jgi:DNA-binding NarL/FixJ family response regulator
MVIKEHVMKTTAKRKHILLVGDTYFIRNELAEFFQVHGYGVVSVGSDGKEILAGLWLKPEVIFVDYEMQHNDPYLVTAILHVALPSSCIALMNGNTQHCNRQEAKTAGAKYILSRTCDVSTFNEILHNTEEDTKS